MHTPTAWLASLDTRIEREILRLRARYELSLDEFRGLYISDEQVDRLVAISHSELPVALAPPLERPSSPIRSEHARWRHLAQTFSLSPLEEDLLLIALAPELNRKYETLYAYLNNDVSRKCATEDLAARLMADLAAAGVNVTGSFLVSRFGIPRIWARPDDRDYLIALRLRRRL